MPDADCALQLESTYDIIGLLQYFYHKITSFCKLLEVVCHPSRAEMLLTLHFRYSECDNDSQGGLNH